MYYSATVVLAVVVPGSNNAAHSTQSHALRCFAKMDRVTRKVTRHSVAVAVAVVTTRRGHAGRQAVE